MKIKTFLRTFVQMFVWSVVGVLLFVWILGVLAKYPDAPSGQNVGGWLWEFFDFNRSGTWELIVATGLGVQNWVNPWGDNLVCTAEIEGTMRYNKTSQNVEVCDGVKWKFANGAGGETSDVKTVSVSAGSHHSLALKSDGTVWAWGYNYFWQLGDGTAQNRYLPVLAGVINDVTAISAGGIHSLALKSDGTVWAWGNDAYGQLGDNTISTRNTATRVFGLNDIIAIEAGDYYSLALKSDGTVWAWGYNYFWQLGDGTKINRETPVQVLTDVVNIEAWTSHSIAIKSDGTVWAWGYNSSGELGDGTKISRETPVQVLTDVVNIEAWHNHSIAIKSDWSVWLWGTGLRYTSPVQISNLTDVVDVAEFYVVKSDGTLWEIQSDSKSALHVNYSPLKNLIAITSTANWYYSLVLRSDGTLWSWGRNVYGQLGQGNTLSHSHPFPVFGQKYF